MTTPAPDALRIVHNASPCDRHACSACCHDTEMPLTEEDIARLVKLGHPRDGFVAVGLGGVTHLKTVEAPEGAPGRPCYFLKENRCSVYADRPQGCRIYPFTLTEEGRVVRDDDCPHRAEFPHDPSAQRRIAKIMATLGREAKRRGRGA